MIMMCDGVNDEMKMIEASANVCAILQAILMAVLLDD